MITKFIYWSHKLGRRNGWPIKIYKASFFKLFQLVFGLYTLFIYILKARFKLYKVFEKYFGFSLFRGKLRDSGKGYQKKSGVNRKNFDTCIILVKPISRFKVRQNIYTLVPWLFESDVWFKSYTRIKIWLKIGKIKDTKCLWRLFDTQIF